MLSCSCCSLNCRSSHTVSCLHHSFCDSLKHTNVWNENSPEHLKNHPLVVYWTGFLGIYEKHSIKYVSYSSCNSQTDNPHQQERGNCFLKQFCCFCNRSDLCNMVHISRKYLKSKAIDPLKWLFLLHKSGLKSICLISYSTDIWNTLKYFLKFC